jgi:hypothetical protein
VKLEEALVALVQGLSGGNHQLRLTGTDVVYWKLELVSQWLHVWAWRHQKSPK